MTRRIVLAFALLTGLLLSLAPAAPAGPQAQHTCAVTSRGAVKCWGSNFAGALGDGTTTDRSAPVDVSGLTSGATEVTTGSLHTCAVVTGAAKCWGSNLGGKLGDGTTTNRLTPVDVVGLGSGVAQISAANNHTCALTPAGAVKCWGLNGAGQLGDANLPIAASTPVNVSGLGSGVAQISTGFSHTCALTTTGAVKCWGLNSAGQLGDGTNVNRSAPVDVSGLGSGVVQISAGSNHTCVLTTAGTVKCWGDNASGVLGDGTTVNRSIPVDVSGLGSSVAQVSAGDLHTCALMAAGTAKCWGNNLSFQLGFTTINANQLTPMDVPGLSGIDQISPAFRHTCALVGGVAKCWGADNIGQLGDGATGPARATPSDVSGLGGGVTALPEFFKPRATLIVIKQVVNDNGGTAVASDWTMSVAGNHATPASFPGAGAPGTTLTLDPGAYSVSENGPAGYNSAASPDCAGMIAAGETKTCTITADDQPATLIVITNVINDDGGTLTPADFTLTVLATNPSPASFPGAAAPGTTVTLDPGPYDVGIPPHGYTITHSADCGGTIAAGETKTCTITADDQPATLIVITNVINDDGGTLTPADFTLTVLATNPSPASFPGAAAPGTTVTLDPGPYDVGIPPHGYTITHSADCGGTIAAGETKTCTITANDQPTRGTLVVITNVINDDGGTLTPADFTLTVLATNPSPASFPGAAAPGTTVTLDPGPYDVGIPPHGYTITHSADCGGTIAAGETKTCTITANDPSDTAPPTVTCDTADGVWHAANISIGCTARDGGSGLAHAADASFSLSTTVPNGSEDANASTESRQVCDLAGNCATAGPVGGNKIDLRAPTVYLPADMTVDATSPAGAIVAFIVTASDGADPNPSVTCTPGAGSLVAIGTTTVPCRATDHVGNTSNRSFKITVLGAKEQLNRLIQKVVNASTLPPATKTQLIGRLQSLVAGFDPTNPVQRKAVCTALRAFVAAVQLLSGHGISPAQAAEWIADANRIRGVLAC